MTSPSSVSSRSSSDLVTSRRSGVEERRIGGAGDQWRRRIRMLPRECGDGLEDDPGGRQTRGRDDADGGFAGPDAAAMKSVMFSLALRCRCPSIVRPRDLTPPKQRASLFCARARKNISGWTSPRRPETPGYRRRPGSHLSRREAAKSLPQNTLRPW